MVVVILLIHGWYRNNGCHNARCRLVRSKANASFLLQLLLLMFMMITTSNPSFNPL